MGAGLAETRRVAKSGAVMAGVTSRDPPHDWSNGRIERQQDRGIERDQTPVDTDRTRSDRDQTPSERERFSQVAAARRLVALSARGRSASGRVRRGVPE